MIAGTGILPSQTEKSPGELYAEAQKAYKEKDYKNFLSLYRQMERLLPHNRVVLYNLAAAYSLNKDKENTLLCLKRTLPVNAADTLGKDPDFQWLRLDPEFKRLVAASADLRKPLLNSRTAFVIKQRDLHPESIAFDPATGIFYIGSVHHRKIVARNSKGEMKDFVLSAHDGLDAVMGLKIDSKRRLLWVTTVATPHMIGYKPEDLRRTAIVGFNLDSGRSVAKKIVHEAENHLFGDLAIHPSGDVFVTDSSASIVYRFHPPTGKLETIARDDSFYSLQGLDFSPDGSYLFVEEYGSGVFLIDVASKKILWKIEHSADAPLTGIDGLYFYENSLVGIQNGVSPNRISQFYLDKDFKKVERVRVLERDNPHFNEPTLGLVADGHLYYIANSQWKHYEKDGTIFPHHKLEDIVILKVPLSE
jgi:hypothetical protein